MYDGPDFFTEERKDGAAGAVEYLKVTSNEPTRKASSNVLKCYVQRNFVCTRAADAYGNNLLTVALILTLVIDSQFLAVVVVFSTAL
ncbi:hypothetical protein EV421DRAFT_1902740 [Armillaria borealis]|uniref:Uncharacterized protein n=1 Tax=Armillaria borealis TaxID=47425 RepID=A0AA39JNQ1_9AGAR|nr:hypothetical protein EV421DRAFT_1902740 [Armillaria borealis]